jgi:Transcriptional regulators
VSRGLVSLALSGREGVREETRGRILEAARSIGYVRNIGAAALAGRFHSTLGVVLPDLRNPFFEGLVASIQGRGTELDLLPLVVTALDDPQREAMVMTRLHELRVAGVVLVSPVETARDLVEVARSLPLAVIGTEPIGDRLDVIHMDEDAAAHLLVDHVASRGWTRLLHLSGSPTAGDTWVERRRRALASASGDMPFAHVRLAEGEPISPLISAHQPLDRSRPLAIVTHNDLLAIDVVPAVQSMGLVPGRDIAIVSYDDTHMAARPEWSLTSVHQDTDLLCMTAIDNLLSRQEERDLPARETVVAPSLTIRSTS